LEASRRSVPEVTDEFADRVRPGLTAAELLAELRKAIDEEDAKEFKPERNKALGESLTKVMNVQVPDSLVTNQAREKFALMMSDMRNGGVSDEEIKRQISPENFAKYKDIVKADIIRDFKISMAADEIARLEQITVPAYQIEEQMESIKKDATESSEQFDEAMIRAKVESTMTRQAVFDWLAERGTMHAVYENENGEEEFDQELMQKLAKESLEREGIDSSVVEAVVEEVEEEVAVVEAKAVETKVEEPAVVETEIVESTVEEPAVVVAEVAETKVEEPAPVEDKKQEEKEVAVVAAAGTAPAPVKEEAPSPVVAKAEAEAQPPSAEEKKKDDSSPNLLDAFSKLFKF
jgi:Bacterial trigger factor protein (TF) C-terminus